MPDEDQKKPTETTPDERLSKLIESLTKRNGTTQQYKQKSSPWGWVLAIVSALIAMVGIGVAIYFQSKRGRELAKAKTEIEQRKVDEAHARHEALKLQDKRARQAHLAAATVHEHVTRDKAKKLKDLEEAHRARKLELDKLSAWDDINAK